MRMVVLDHGDSPQPNKLAMALKVPERVPDSYLSVTYT